MKPSPKPNANRIAFTLLTTYCALHGERKLRAHCMPCLQDKIGSAIYDTAHPDVSLSEALRAINDPQCLSHGNEAAALELLAALLVFKERLDARAAKRKKS